MRRAAQRARRVPDVCPSPSPVPRVRCEAARLDEGTSSRSGVKFFRRLTSHPQENNSVTELREKIKTFLASQDMIKGHSGSGPRSNEKRAPHPHARRQPPDPPALAVSSNPHNIVVWLERSSQATGSRHVIRLGCRLCRRSTPSAAAYGPALPGCSASVAD